jgi:hypothetical protein
MVEKKTVSIHRRTVGAEKKRSDILIHRPPTKQITLHRRVKKTIKLNRRSKAEPVTEKRKVLVKISPLHILPKIMSVNRYKVLCPLCDAENSTMRMTCEKDDCRASLYYFPTRFKIQNDRLRKALEEGNRDLASMLLARNIMDVAATYGEWRIDKDGYAKGKIANSVKVKTKKGEAHDKDEMG